MQNENQGPDSNLAAMLDETNRLLAEARTYADGGDADDAGSDPGVASILDVADKMISQARGVAEGQGDPGQLEAVQHILAEQAAHQQRQETEAATEDAVAEKGDLAGGAYPASFDPGLASLFGQASQMVTDTQAYIQQQAPVPSTSTPLVDPSLVAALEDPASAPMTDPISSTLSMTNTALGEAQSIAQGQYTPEQMADATQRYDHTSNLIDGYLQQQAEQQMLADQAQQVQEGMMDNPFPSQY